MISFDPKLIFLDIDGVLNGHDYDKEARSNRIDYDKMLLFNQILEETGAYIVLSSAWRYLVHRGDMTLQGLDWLLRSHGMKSNRLVGITEMDRMAPYWEKNVLFNGEDERGKQIANYLNSNRGQPWGKYIVIDDGGEGRDGKWTDLGMGDAGHPVVWTQSKYGLTPEHVATAIGHLNYVQGIE